MSVTTVSPSKFAEQLVPQLIPAGLEVTVPPSNPLLETVSVNRITNADALDAVPSGVVTRMGPVVAVVGTVARIEVAEMTEKAAATPLKVTVVAPVRFAPEIVTVEPATPPA